MPHGTGQSVGILPLALTPSGRSDLVRMTGFKKRGQEIAFLCWQRQYKPFVYSVLRVQNCEIGRAKPTNAQY